MSVDIWQRGDLLVIGLLLISNLLFIALYLAATWKRDQALSDAEELTDNVLRDYIKLADEHAKLLKEGDKRKGEINELRDKILNDIGGTADEWYQHR